MNIFNNTSTSNNICVTFKENNLKKPCNEKWQLTDELKETIIELAKEDAKSNIYMGDKFISMKKAEAQKVAPDRKALIGKCSGLMNSANKNAAKNATDETPKNLLFILFGKQYEAKIPYGQGSYSIHVYNDNGEEVLTYTHGVGWHERETQAEVKVHSTLTPAYYNAFQEARKQINAGGIPEADCGGEEMQSTFDVQA